jgi:hypothetical protein
MGRDGFDRAVIDVLHAELGGTVRRLIRRNDPWPSYEIHVASPTLADHDRIRRRMEFACRLIGAPMSWHILGARAAKTWSQPGRILFPALAIVRPA